MDYLYTNWRKEYIKSLEQSSSGCVFCDKLDRPDEDELVLERGETCYVCLNMYPYTNGHLLVVPYQHVSCIDELDPQVLAEMMNMSQKSVRILKEKFYTQGFNIGLNLGSVAGAGLPDHVHLHVVPRWQGDANFMSVICNTKVISELLEESFSKLRDVWPIGDESQTGD
ncbi:MAG: HIT domain-containing protein [Chloroflexota bacterium]